MLNSYINKDSNLYYRLLDFIFKFTGQMSNKLALSMSLKNDLGVDSLTLTEMIISVEETFDIFLEEDDLNPENMQTVEDIFFLVFKYVGKKEQD